MNTDVLIAQAHTPRPISQIASEAGIAKEAVIPFGAAKAKIDMHKVAPGEPGRLVLVTGMSPTPAGEGKSTVLIGLADGLRRLGVRSAVAIREPSLGPVLGIKGGAAGGGYSQVIPMEDINLHFTGDMHAITAANNALAALIDNHIFHGNALDIDPERVLWRRCIDMNDRSLRQVHTLAGPSGFDITAASEMMAVLCLATSLGDLHERIDRILVALTSTGKPVFARDLAVTGSLVALLRDAFNPNLVQTLEGTPAFIHGGPFANIAHGTNSLVATRVALQHSEVVLTEAGFGADLGAEKFTHLIAADNPDLAPAVTVVVVTTRAVDVQGIENVTRHCENLRRMGHRPVIAVNAFTGDNEDSMQPILEWAQKEQIPAAVVTSWADGGAGAQELGQLVMQHLGEASVKPLYEPSMGVAAAIEKLALTLYRASAVEFSDEAREDLKILSEHGWDHLPVCISKTQYSFSDDPALTGAPEGHVLHVQRLIPKLGAGFVVALTGKVFTMPGLPARPAAEKIGVDDEGVISGLF